MFCEEKGINLIELSEKVGVSTEELEPIEALHFVPVNIASKIVSEYALPENYFTEDLDAPRIKPSAKRSFGYFLGISLLWTLALNLLTSVLSTLNSLIPFTSEASSVFFRAYSLLTNSLIMPAVTIFSCILVAKLVVKNGGNAGNFEKYKYFFKLVPMGILVILNLPSRFFLEYYVNGATTGIMMYTTVTGIMSVISFILTVIICAAMMNVAFGEPNDRKQKTLNTFFIVAFALNTLYYIVCVLLFARDEFAFAELTMAISNIILFAVVVLGGFFGMKKKPENDKIWCTALPLGYYAINLLGSVISFVTTL